MQDPIQQRLWRKIVGAKKDATTTTITTIIVAFSVIILMNYKIDANFFKGWQ
jgi:hypothetical protein